MKTMELEIYEVMELASAELSSIEGGFFASGATWFWRWGCIWNCVFSSTRIILTEISMYNQLKNYFKADNQSIKDWFIKGIILGFISGFFIALIFLFRK